ncbi:hypothetical protein ACWGKK_28100 [Streptomyces chartreusis]|uniref:hypothetical protein n=1 Tax=Streptomyces sp. KS_5 TaxID=1881018 RepID=UPI0008984A0E|nr:hypothetical protein [Streptomyces sp. KS_5]SEC17406.1 hypothetical protein SAMN05428938_1435 [Streptomyces sp. KS_5]
MSNAEATRARRTASTKVGVWSAGLGLLAATSVLGLWLFTTVPDVRQLLILFCLGTAVVCLLVIALHQRSSGGRRSANDVALAACARATEEAQYSAPASAAVQWTLPSRRGQQLRSFFWVVGISTALFGIFALAAGTPQRSELVERIHAAGAEFGVAQAEKVSDVRRKSSRGKDPYTATVTVQLPVEPGDEPVSATVKTTTNQPLRPGDAVDVLYAPAQPRLGAVAGDESSLGAELRGETMPAYMRWLFVAAWVFSCLGAAGHVSMRHGFRSLAHLGSNDKAIRGRYWRVGGAGSRTGQESSGKETYLEIQTDAGHARFHTSVGKQGLPAVMEGQQLWLCWDSHRGGQKSRFSPSRTPAVLVFDTGLVVHGMMKVDDVETLNDSGVSVEKLGPTPEMGRPFRLFDARAQWPLIVEPLVLQVCLVVLVCAALLTFDVANGWRWTAGIVGFLGVFAAAGLYVGDDTSTKRAEA